MAMQLGALRTALLNAGASADAADKAAEEVAPYETRVTGLETRVAVLTWMVGVNVGLTILVLGGLVTLSAKMGEIGCEVAALAARIH